MYVFAAYTILNQHQVLFSYNVISLNSIDQVSYKLLVNFFKSVYYAASSI